MSESPSDDELREAVQRLRQDASIVGDTLGELLAEEENVTEDDVKYAREKVKAYRRTARFLEGFVGDDGEASA